MEPDTSMTQLFIVRLLARERVAMSVPEIQNYIRVKRCRQPGMLIRQVPNAIRELEKRGRMRPTSETDPAGFYLWELLEERLPVEPQECCDARLNP